MHPDLQQFLKKPIDVATAFIVLAVPPLAAMGTGQPLILGAALYLNIAALTLYDFLYYRLPNLLTFTFFCAASVAAYVSGPFPMSWHLAGAAAGLLLPILLNMAYRKLRGRDGIGMGDAKLLAGAGMLVAWPSLPMLLAFASLAGLGYAFVRLRNKTVTSSGLHIPFGPFIGAVTLSVWWQL